MSEVNSTASAAPAESSANATGETNSTDGAQDKAQQTNEAQAIVERRKYKYKVDGKEVEEELSDSDVQKHLSMSKAAYKRMQEAASEKKQAQEFVKMLRENPEAVLNNEQIMGSKKFREIAEQYLSKQLQEEMLSPEEKHKREMESKLKQYEETEKQQRQQAEAKQMEQLQAHYAQDYEQKIITGLQSQNIPKTPRTVKRMAELMSKNLQYQLELEPQQLAEIVKQDYIKEIQELFGATESDALLNLLGDGVSNKIRQADLKKLKASNPFGQSKQQSNNQQIQSEKPTHKMSKDEWREYLDKKVNS